MLAGTLFGTLTAVTALAPSVLSVFNSPVNSKWPNVAIATLLAWGLTWVFGHHAGALHVTSSWFSPTGICGKGDLVGGFLITVVMYSGLIRLALGWIYLLGGRGRGLIPAPRAEQLARHSWSDCAAVARLRQCAGTVCFDADVDSRDLPM